MLDLVRCLLPRVRMFRRKVKLPNKSVGGRQPASLSSVLDAVIKHARLLQLVLIAVGVLGLCLVPLLDRKIDFDENALLAGSARPTISASSPSVYEAGKSFADGLQHAYNTFIFSTALQEALTQQGFEVSNHTFTVPAAATAAAGTVKSSSSNSGYGSGVVECVNVHAVVPAPRGDGKEALVLVTPLNQQHFSTDFQQDQSGVRLSLALGFALMSHMSRVTWLSKDVIWLLPDASCGLVEAVEAWTDAYQLLPLDQAGSLPHFSRAGVLQQALLLELPSGHFNRLQVGLEGHAGQLPKLDMYWLYRWYSQAYVTAPVELPELKTHLQPVLQTVYDTLQPGFPLLQPLLQLDTATISAAVYRHLHKLQLMWQFMGRQATGLPTGAHAAFKGLGVDAATLRVLTKNDQGLIVGPAGFLGGGNAGSMAPGAAAMQQQSLQGGGQQTDFNQLGAAAVQTLVGFDPALHQLGNVMEVSLRSCSVLIERFHHSLFLYVLTDLNSYVSVERYIVPLVVLICVLVLQAAYIARPQEADGQQQQQHQHTGGDACSQGDSSVGCSQVEGSRGSTGSANPPQPQQPRMPTLQLPKSQAAATLNRKQWVTALMVVGLTHVTTVGVAMVLRYPVVSLLSRWFQGQHGLQGLGIAVALLLPLAFGLEGVASLIIISSSSITACSDCTTDGSGGHDGGTDSSILLGQQCSAVDIRKVFVVELSLCAAVLAAVACINWALGYVTCLLLVPFVVGSSAGTTASFVARAMQAVIVTCSSPLSVLLFLSASTAGVGVANAFQVAWLSWLVHGSSTGTYLVACGVYLPCWLLAAAVFPQCK